jgi:phosphatidylinositol alpha-mannosyltransferase
MRIALLHPSYWPEVRRGSERLVHDLGATLAGRGYDVTLLTSHRGRRRVSSEDGIRVVRAWRPPDRLMHRRAYEHYMTVIPASILALLRGGYDIAHAFYPTDAWAAVQARRLGGPPVIFSMHGIPTRPYLVTGRYRLAMLKHTIRAATATVVLSEAAAEPFRRFLMHEPHVLPGGVFCDSFAVDAERSTEPTLVCAASLDDPRKRAEVLREAFERLRERRPGARLLLAGRTDPRHGRLQLELPPGARLVDGDETGALARAYATSWASVLPAVEEAFGLVLLESLAAGTPVVAARSGACPEVLSADSLGRLFEPGDAEALARAMDEALDLGLRPETAAACRARAREYDWSRVVPRYEALYEAVAEGRGARAPLED